jgi:hypothetical protein
MTAEMSDRIREIADARNIPESEVIEEALERGIEDLWVDLTLTQYFDADIDRETTIDLLDHSTVERAEAEIAVVEEDVDWGLTA